MKIPSIPTGWLCAAAFGVGLAAGAVPVKWYYQAQIGDLTTTHAKEQASAERQARQRLQAAQTRGDALTTRLALTESALATKTLEVSHALQKVTTGRPCLGLAAVRLLNGAPEDQPGAMPPAAGQPAAADAAVATDTDVAGWINTARGQYDTCRGRLDALIDFETGAAP